MEEPIRFADILFTALTLLIIYLILFYVNKSKRKILSQSLTIP